MALPFYLISTDFDGTLHAQEENPPVPLQLQDLIAGFQKEGGSWVINTGRDLRALLAILDKSRLAVQPDYLITVEREIHVRNGSGYFPSETWNRKCSQEQEQLFARVRPELPSLNSWIRSEFPVLIYEDAYSPFCLVASNNADADAILDFVSRRLSHIPELSIVRNDVYARFSHAAYNKGTALSEVARQLDLTPAQVLAAGDHHNDFPMLSKEHAAWLVAPANAIPQIKDWVSRQDGYISSLPHGHGVADGLAHFLNGSRAKGSAPSLRLASSHWRHNITPFN